MKRVEPALRSHRDSKASSAARGKELDAILEGVSRSFFLSLRVVPRAMREQLCVGYLFCRAADTIADTRLLAPARRLEMLELFRARFTCDDDRANASALETIARGIVGTSDVAREHELLSRLPDVFAVYRRFDANDRALLERLVLTLTRGMEMDLERFPDESSGEVGALETDEDLDRYCYHVAGCVGEFWSDLQHARVRALSGWDVERWRPEGVRFGKALQMTNILRDADRDFAIGRVYLPRVRLEARGIEWRELPRASDRSALRPIVHDLLRLTLDHYRAGWAYTLSLPRRAPRLRLACVWPLWIGLRTLELLALARDPCAPDQRIKISRTEVARVIRSSVLRVASIRALDATFRALEARVVRALENA